MIPALLIKQNRILFLVTQKLVLRKKLSDEEEVELNALEKETSEESKKYRLHDSAQMNEWRTSWQRAKSLGLNLGSY